MWWKTRNLNLCLWTNVETNQAKIEKISISQVIQLGFLRFLVSAIRCEGNKSNLQSDENPLGLRAVKMLRGLQRRARGLVQHAAEGNMRAKVRVRMHNWSIFPCLVFSKSMAWKKFALHRMQLGTLLLKIEFTGKKPCRDWDRFFEQWSEIFLKIIIYIAIDLSPTNSSWTSFASSRLWGWWAAQWASRKICVNPKSKLNEVSYFNQSFKSWFIVSCLASIFYLSKPKTKIQKPKMNLYEQIHIVDMGKFWWFIYNVCGYQYKSVI